MNKAEYDHYRKLVGLGKLDAPGVQPLVLGPVISTSDEMGWNFLVELWRWGHPVGFMHQRMFTSQGGREHNWTIWLYAVDLCLESDLYVDVCACLADGVETATAEYKYRKYLLEQKEGSGGQRAEGRTG